MNKYVQYIFVCFLAIISLWSCDKDAASDEKILTERIYDIIPQEYLDSLTKLGFNINSGTTPPILNGSFDVKPVILQAITINNDYSIGYRFLDAVVSLSGQNNKNYSIDLLGQNFLGTRDTSLYTAISGSGNNFTVYGKVKSTINNSSAMIAILFSGELDGDNIKNMKVGLVNIDKNSNPLVFMATGSARIIYDSDYISPKLPNSAKNKVGVVNGSSTSGSSALSR